MRVQLSLSEILENDLQGVAKIERLAREIWSEHYTSLIGPDQVTYMLDHFQSKAAVRAQIKDGYRYFIIELDGKSAGYFAVKLRNPDSKGLREMFLSKLYVLNECRGQGVGRQVIAAVEDLSRKARAGFITLTVNKHNTHSIHFYEQLGFEKAGSFVQDIGGGFVMDDFMFKKVLNGPPG